MVCRCPGPRLENAGRMTLLREAAGLVPVLDAGPDPLVLPTMIVVEVVIEEEIIEGEG